MVPTCARTQLATVSAVLLARVRMVQRLPPLLTAALQDAAILKVSAEEAYVRRPPPCDRVMTAWLTAAWQVGVNINGDGERLRRDLKASCSCNRA